jgi:hypothetical protein
MFFLISITRRSMKTAIGLRITYSSAPCALCVRILKGKFNIERDKFKIAGNARQTHE